MLIPRRRFLQLAAAAVPAAALPVPVAASVGEVRTELGELGIRPRADWAGGSVPAAAMPSERDGDVRFLLVHHSVSPNDHAPGDVPGLIRGFRDAHAAKGWPDVAYNFFVDRFGGVWEGRAGSLAGPVIADATGGNQGFSQLCCLIGDFRTQPPSERAVDALTRVLAALADRYGVDTASRARTTFVSRGSNRWPAGTTVTTPTIAGHRDMSRTECPGDACYAMIRGTVVDRVNALRAGTAPPANPGPAPGAPGVGTAGAPVADTGGGTGDDTGDGTTAIVAAAAAAAVGGAAVWGVSRRARGTVHRPAPDPGTRRER